MFPDLSDLGKGIGLICGIAFIVPLAAACWAGGLGWWTALAVPVSPLIGLTVGAALDAI